METTRELAKRDRKKIKNKINKYLKRPTYFSYYGSLDMFNTWALGPVIETRDSGILEKSNAVTIEKWLNNKPELENQWELVTCNHWAVGWVTHLSFKVCDRVSVLHTEVFKLSPMIEFMESLQEKLDQYPILDEEDYSNREYESIIENLRDSIRIYSDHDLIDPLPEGYEYTLFSWFDDNNQAVLDSGENSYPSDDQLYEAIKDLDWIAKETLKCTTIL